MDHGYNHRPVIVKEREMRNEARAMMRRRSSPLKAHCGIGTKGAIDANRALAAAYKNPIVVAAPVASEPDIPAPAQHHIDCTTLRLDRDLSTTQCD
jgi:hypothetical protein